MRTNGSVYYVKTVQITRNERSKTSATRPERLPCDPCLVPLWSATRARSEAVRQIPVFPCGRYSSTSPARRFLSFSLTPDELPQLEEWGDCPRLFEDLRDLRRPLRVGDSSSYVRSLRLSAPVLQCKNPARYADTSPGVRAVGLFASEKKDGREFMIENEEVSRMPERFVTPPGALKGNRRFGRRSHHADRRARGPGLVQRRPTQPSSAKGRGSVRSRGRHAQRSRRRSLKCPTGDRRDSTASASSRSPERTTGSLNRADTGLPSRADQRPATWPPRSSTGSSTDAIS